MLPDANEPLVLHDGTIISPSGGVVQPAPPRYVEVPRQAEAQKLVVATRRKLADLPAPPKQLNTVSVVLMYTMVGLMDYEIAIATGMTEQQIANIRMSETFGSLHDVLIESIIESDGEDVRTLFAANARQAAKRVIGMIQDEDKTIALRASADILDRGGHRPADVVEHRHRLDGALLIEVIHKDKNIDVPVIDVTPE